MRKKKSKQKYKPLSDATPEDFQKAMQMGSFWLADQLEGHTESGAFSEAFLGEEPRLYFTKKAYNTLKDPQTKWKWKEGTKLSTLYINVMRSDMAHELRRYIDLGEPDVMPSSSFEREEGSEGWDDSNDVLEVNPELKRRGYPVDEEMEMLEELERYESLREKGLKIARAAAKASGDVMLEKYVEAVFTLPDYRTISKKLKITQAEVLELEAKLIVIFRAK